MKIRIRGSMLSLWLARYVVLHSAAEAVPRKPSAWQILRNHVAVYKRAVETREHDLDPSA